MNYAPVAQSGESGGLISHVSRRFESYSEYQQLGRFDMKKFTFKRNNRIIIETLEPNFVTKEDVMKRVKKEKGIDLVLMPHLQCTIERLPDTG